MQYWDSSALVKLYLAEADSAEFDHLMSRAGRAIATSTIAAAELLCTAYRKESDGDLRSGGAAVAVGSFEKHCRTGRIVQIPYDEKVLARVDRLVQLALTGPRPLMLRALDAIHIATAVEARATAMVATDRRLREMAGRIGLDILP